MGNPYFFQVQKATEQLIRVHFELEPWHKAFLIVFADCFKQVALIVVHDYIQKLLIILIGKVRILHGEYVGVLQHF